MGFNSGFKGLIKYIKSAYQPQLLNRSFFCTAPDESSAQNLPSSKILFIYIYIYMVGALNGGSARRTASTCPHTERYRHRQKWLRRAWIINHVSRFPVSFEHTPYLPLSMSSTLQSTEIQTVPLYRPTACNISHIDKTLRISALQRIRFHSTQSISVFFFGTSCFWDSKFNFCLTASCIPYGPQAYTIDTDQN